ncbi:CPBP family intramembrane metalloprotease, partial [bacterium]|nr:CPBP family intramembrane metalloprotease [bacterium]
YGILAVSIVFASLHIGHLSLIDVIFVFGVAIFFSIIVLKTNSIIGVALAHGITNVALYLIWPFIL